jgi:amino acid adenylation domain-containing protein
MAGVRTPAGGEAVLVDVWTELLGAAPAGASEDFFAGGGDSILAAALVTRVSGELGVTVSLGEFVREPTISALERLVEAARETGQTESPIPGRSGDDERVSRCSFGQERFWFIDQASGGNVVSNVSWALRLRGVLDVPALERALAALVARHDTLRTRFELRDGVPAQIVEPTGEIPLTVLAVADDAQARGLAASAAEVSFDLSRGPLLRAQLLALRAQEHVLHFVAHHVVCDDWSKGVILSELGGLYAAISAGEAPALPQPAVQYPAFAQWQRARWDDAALGEELGHWQRRLAGAPPALELATDHPRPPAPSLRGARLRTTVPAELASSARALGRQEGATFFMTMLAALEAVLHRYSGQDDFVIGTAIDNRGRVELESAVGLFTNVIALRADVSGGPSFRELLARARSGTLDALGHQELPFDRLAASVPERDASRHPVFQVFYEFIVPAPLELRMPGIEAEPFEVPKHTSEFDLGLYLDEQRGGLDAVWEYSTDLFEPETVERLACHFVALLRELVDAPDLPVAELSLLDGTERRRALVEGNETSAPVPEAGIEELFEARARHNGDAPALVADGAQLTYRELNARANQIAHLLRERGVGPGGVVGVCLDRTPWLVASILGILKAGAAYAPLNPDHPAARVVAQLDSAAARLLIAERELPGFEGELLTLDAGRLASLPDTDPERVSDPDRLAYVLYTSGSTGVPKGVEVSHRNLVNYTLHMLGVLAPESDASALHFGSVSALSTDLGNTTVFGALAGGGCLHLIAGDVSSDAALFADYVREHPLDVLKITPSHLSSLLDSSDESHVLPRRWLILGGEALTWQLAERVCVTGGPRVMNHYGPTEATVGCCTYAVDTAAPRPPAATVPIGRPIANTRVYVLDSHLEPVPIGVPGELYVGGAGVARGYVGQPEQTAQAFLTDPFLGGEGRMYRTGDLVRHLPDGNVEFLGRVDQQVKIRGFRVEPAEVQAALMRHGGVRQAAVLAVGEGEGKRLVAYVVADEDEVSTDALRGELARTLPSYMIPASITRLSALPLTPNGKLDRAALPGPEPAAAGEPGAAAAPLSELEEQISAIWSELLEHRVGVDESFFDAGGHSLLAIRLVARLRAGFGVKLNLRDLFGQPTIAGLAALVEGKLGGQPRPSAASESAPATQIPRRGPDERLVLSYSQQQLWFIDQQDPGASTYKVTLPFRIRGPLDLDALGDALARLLLRHEVLRTVIRAEHGEPVPVLLDDPPFGLVRVDATAATAEDRWREALDLLAELVARPFDFSRDPFLRACAVSLGEADHVLLIETHHIAYDNWSERLLMEELSALYEGRELPDVTLQYGDYSVWERTRLSGSELAAQQEFWRQHLGGARTSTELPVDHPRPQGWRFRGASHALEFDPGAADAVAELCRQENVTPYMVVLCALATMLYRVTGQDDLLIGSPVANRPSVELETLFGFVNNTVVFRVRLGGNPTFAELLGRVREMALGVYAHQGFPFEQIVQAVRPAREPGMNPLFRVSLQMGAERAALRLSGLEVTPLTVDNGLARFDFALDINVLAQGINGLFRYNRDIFEPDTVARLADEFTGLLRVVLAEPGTRLLSLPLAGLWREPGQAAAEGPGLRSYRRRAQGNAATPNR